MTTEASGGWRILVDRGGTFTDVIGVAPDGRVVVRKVLSSDVGGEDATVAAIRSLAGPLPGAVESVRMGTTVATNALLTRRGASLALATTRGFGDALLIGTQERPELFSLRIKRPAPLPRHVVEIDERVLADGTVRLAPSEDAVRAALRRARAAGCDALAIALVHGWLFPAHELLVASVAAEEGFGLVVTSSECDPEPGFLARLQTTVIEAFVTPPLRRHVGRLREAFPAADLRLMTSAGALVRAESFRGRDAVLSGPAGGAVALREIAAGAGCSQAIGLDMGGTSTDACRWSAEDDALDDPPRSGIMAASACTPPGVAGGGGEVRLRRPKPGGPAGSPNSHDSDGSHGDPSRFVAGDLDRASERSIAGLRVRAPMVDVVTVAAGGGSILERIGGRLVAGPASAGASPGPACYRAGGPATVTDANVVLGRVQPRWFPSCFGPSGDQPIDPELSRRALEELGAGMGLSAEEAALGAVRIANEAMARALQQVSVARGRDPREHALVAFGGAAPQHACALADLLGMRRVLVHPLAGVLSALGMGLADAGVSASRPLLVPLDDEGLAAAGRALDESSVEQVRRMEAEGVPAEACRLRRLVEIRHRGVDSSIAVTAPRGISGTALRELFEARHERLFGFRRESLDAEIVSVRVEASGSLPRLDLPGPAQASGAPQPQGSAILVLEDGGAPVRREIPAFARASLGAGHVLPSPCLISDATSTIVVDPGWEASVTEDGSLDLRRAGPSPRGAVAQRAVRLEVFGSRFMGIAEQMGESLRRTARSPNIKERLDYSCALFTRDGRLVANAPHVPVHLGAMGQTVRALLHCRGEAGFTPGCAIVSNDPHRGGSHLPDITVVSPVHAEDGTLRFFVANRGHHADVGGIAPGSMPPFATELSQEGVVLHDVALVERGSLREGEIAALMAAGPHPVRGIPERLADLRAQAAANATGARLLRELCAEQGMEAVERAMAEVIEDAAEATRELLASLPAGTHRFADEMDEGARVEVAVTIADGRARFDFTGTSGQQETSLNAPRAVVRACVLYALRCLLGRDVPLNEGVLEPIDIVIPDGTLLSPGATAAVCGGNVETSMRVADVVLAALGAQAASQGTMNNVTFGNDSIAFYETIGGGAGAGPTFAGASAVHSHLTNTRITDVETLERRAPVIVREFSVRRGSGGAGAFRGGDGIVRALELRAALTVSLLTERRRSLPFGLEGGGPGACGRNLLLRADGTTTDLGGKASFQALPGDVIVVETPGGGGHGPAGARERPREP